MFNYHQLKTLNRSQLIRYVSCLKAFLFLALNFFITVNRSLKAQHIEILSRERPVSLRGLSVVNDKVVWVSGNKGTVGKSLNGGKSWKWMVVNGFEHRDFRDIEAFDKNTAIIMAIAEPATILKTTDGGTTWKEVYENKVPGMFLDAMEFSDLKNGVVLGDPVNGKFFIATTNDQGNTWKEMPAAELPSADSGEACFASSGTNIRKLYGNETCFISGGKRSRYFSRDLITALPVIQGTGSTGANSIAVREDASARGNKYLVVVGGDFTSDTLSLNNCFISKDAGKTWFAPALAPKGYRSCVEFINRHQLLTCGLSGVDFSSDSGINWKLVSKESFHVCKKARKGATVFLAGTNGKIGKLIMK